MIAIVLLILVVVVGITAYLNRAEIKDKEVMIENHSFVIMADGKEIDIVDLGWLADLSSEEFKANLKSSGKDPEEHTYKGVMLKEILASKGQSLQDKSQVIIRSVDGYTVALSSEEVAEDENVYIVYEVDGKPLGTKEDGSNGPYQIVIRKDSFGQRWAKFVVEVELQ